MELPGLSEATQARWMSRHLVRDLADPDLSFTSWFHLSFFEHYSHTCTYNYGVLRTGDYSPKPSFFVLRRIRELFDDGRCLPDATASLMLHAAHLPDGSYPPSLNQALVAGAAVHTFRRNGFPLFAATAVWPTNEAMEPIRVDTTLFDGTAASRWTSPVLLDLVDGAITSLEPFGDGRRVSFDLVNHIRVITEAAALEPYLRLNGGSPPVPAAGPVSTSQESHE